MNHISKLIYASKCKTIHQKVAIESLRFLSLPEKDEWQNYFLRYHNALLRGALAPNAEFFDYKNHICFVGDDYWGDVIEAIEQSYGKLVSALWCEDWLGAAFQAGVVCHYLTDAFSPLQTSLSEESVTIQSAFELAIDTNYGELQQILLSDLGGYEPIGMPVEGDWLEAIIKKGAEKAFAIFDLIIDHFCLEKSVEDPPEGLDQEIKDQMAAQIGFTVQTFALILTQAIEDAHISPPTESTLLMNFFELSKGYAPYTRTFTEHARLEKLQDGFKKFKETGQIVHLMNSSTQYLRTLYAKEVMKLSSELFDQLPRRPTGVLHEMGRPRRMRPNKINLEATIWRPQDSEWKKHNEKDLKNVTTVTMVTPSDAEVPSLGRPQNLVDPISRKHFLAEQNRYIQLSGLRNRRSLPRPLDPENSAVKQNTDILAMDIEHSEDSGGGRKVDQSGDLRRLDINDELIKAPSIGPRTAQILSSLGLVSVKDLLTCDPEKIAQQAQASFITAQAVRKWRKQSLLMCSIPQLGTQDAQILVALGYEDAESVAAASVTMLFDQTKYFVDSGDAARQAIPTPIVDRALIHRWVNSARAGLEPKDDVA